MDAPGLPGPPPSALTAHRGTLVLQAAPITLLTLLSKSSLGKQVQESLNEKLPQLEAEADAVRQRHAGARGGLGQGGGAV